MAWPVDPQLYLTFLGVMAVMAVTPGPANIFAIATGARRGRAAVLSAVAGMNLASLVWFAAAALGLGALVLAFPTAFRVIAVLGALYVAWLGVSAIRDAGRPAVVHEVSEPQLGRNAFLDGFLVQISNPKAVLFFTAVLPPFIDPARPVAPQLAMFAVAMIGLDVVAMCAYGLGGAALRDAMTRPRFRRAFGFLTGFLLLLAAALIVLRLQ